MLSVTRTDGRGGRAGVGSQYHCVHELGDVTFTIIDWEPPSHFISDELALGIPIQFTMQFLPQENGTQIRILYQEPGQGDKNELELMFREAAQDALSRLAELLRRRMADVV